MTQAESGGYSTCSTQRRSDVATKAGTIKEQLTQKEGIKKRRFKDRRRTFCNTDLDHGTVLGDATAVFSLPLYSAHRCCLFQMFCKRLIINLW